MSFKTDSDTVRKLLIPERGWVREFVKLYDKKIEVPAEAIAGTAYAVLSAFVGWRAWIQWTDTREPLNLYTILVGQSAAAHKTTVLKIADRLAYTANERYLELQGESLSSMNDVVRIIDGGHMSGAGLIDAIAPIDDEEARGWALTPPPSALIIWDEIGDLINARGNFLSDTRQMLLRVYNGEQPGSKTRSAYVPRSRASVSLIGTVTTKDWEEMSSDIVTGGFMGRVLALPTGSPDVFIPIPEAIDEERRHNLADWLARLAISPYSVTGFGPVKLSEQATEYWNEWYLCHKKNIVATEIHSLVEAEASGAIFGRYQSTALKLAGLIEISQWNGDTADPPSTYVELDSLQKACEYIDTIMASTVIIATGAMQSQDERFAKRLDSYLVNHDEPVALSKVQRDIRIRGWNGQEFHRAINNLINLGLIEKQIQEGTDSMGRPTKKPFIYKVE